MKSNNREKLNLYTQGHRWAVRGLLVVGLCVIGDVKNVLAGGIKVASGAFIGTLLSLSGSLLVVEDHSEMRLENQESYPLRALQAQEDLVPALSTPKRTCDNVRNNLAEELREKLIQNLYEKEEAMFQSLYETASAPVPISFSIDETKEAVDTNDNYQSWQKKAITALEQVYGEKIEECLLFDNFKNLQAFEMGLGFVQHVREESMANILNDCPPSNVVKKLIIPYKNNFITTIAREEEGPWNVVVGVLQDKNPVQCTDGDFETSDRFLPLSTNR